MNKQTKFPVATSHSRRDLPTASEVTLSAYQSETYARFSYVMDEPVDIWGNPIPMGVPLCGGCDLPIVGGKCDDCEVVFIPAEPILGLEPVRHLGREGYGA